MRVIGDLVTRPARYYPEELATVFKDLHFTYRELNERVNQVGNALLNAGLEKGDRVGILCYNSHFYQEILNKVLRDVYPKVLTKYGVDQRSHPNEDIKNLTKERATQIYWDSYWTPVKADQLKDGVAEVVCNIGVNAGKGRAIKWLQQACNVDVDGVIGPKTLTAANLQNEKLLSAILLNRTEDYYKSIANGRLSKFLKGWLNRNNSLRSYIRARYNS
jgi:hypothetical protein